MSKGRFREATSIAGQHHIDVCPPAVSIHTYSNLHKVHSDPSLNLATQVGFTQQVVHCSLGAGSLLDIQACKALVAEGTGMVGGGHKQVSPG